HVHPGAPEQQQQPAQPVPAEALTPVERLTPPVAPPGVSRELPATPQAASDQGPLLRLEDLERMALESNPTIAQSEAAVRAAEGRRRQAGAFPNPVVGYSGEELGLRAPFSQGGEHKVFAEQTIPIGKLGRSRRIFAREKEQTEALAEAQRQRVLNSVRVLYYDALGAQRMVELRAELARLSSEAVEITRELFNVGQADKPDYLEIEIEAQRAEIDRLRAENDREQVWRALGAMVGRPDLRPTRLVGNLEEAAGALEEEQVLATLLRDSPEVRSARAGIERARAVVSRARAERIPDLFLRGDLGSARSFDPAHTGRQLEGSIEAGITIPIWDRKSGAIAAAQAELEIAERELQRLQLSLRARASAGFREYRNALQVVEKYRTRIIPAARDAYDMYLSNFKQMAASYPQVLIAQRTLFQVQAEYARALVDVRRAGVELRGYLLTGGLEALARPGESGEATEGFKLRSASEASGETDNR
ncbi:MAG TPA: TolC family protein, partial [Pyrinomonadaceae bacterium]|nr:TolC family protein [Pyrinomonadaceae bacterium]